MPESAAPHPQRRPPLVTALRRTAWVLYGVLVAAGALVQTPGTLAWGLVLGLVTASSAALLRQAPGDDLPPQPHPVVAGAVTACLPAAAAAHAVLGVVALPITAGLICVALVLTGLWLGGEPADGPLAWDEAGLRRRLAALPTADLLAEWHGLDRRPAPDGAPPLWHARIRDLLIDEFAERDPAGTRSWLSAGAGEPPDRHVGADNAAADPD